MGGMPNHRRRGDKCTIGWQFTTNPDYYMVHFLEEKEEALGFEICHKHNLRNIDEEEGN